MTVDMVVGICIGLVLGGAAGIFVVCLLMVGTKGPCPGYSDERWLEEDYEPMIPDTRPGEGRVE